MSIDLDRITHPLRLAKGSHQPGTGKGCAMNVISYINGDTQITDYPECSARPLAAMVQVVNDELAGADGFLSPDNSVIVLGLGWSTVGTAEVPESVYWQWISDVLVDPEHGVVKYALPDGAVAIRRVAELAARAARGEVVAQSDWAAARDAAWAAAKVARMREGRNLGDVHPRTGVEEQGRVGHLKGAPSSGWLRVSTPRIIPGQEHLSPFIPPVETTPP